MKRALALLLVCLAPSLGLAQAVSVVEPFAVSAAPVVAFAFPSGETIEANGKTYFVAEALPKKTEAALILTEGGPKWIVARPLKGGRSVKLTPFKPNQFFYEHIGPGEYEVTTLENGEPVFDYFEIAPGTEPPGTDPDPGTDPAPGTEDFAGLLKVAKDKLAPGMDLETRKRLGAAWLEALGKPYTSEAELKKRISVARENVLSFAPITDNSWNTWLVAIDGWFKANPKANYPKAMKALAASLVQ